MTPENDGANEAGAAAEDSTENAPAAEVGFAITPEPPYFSVIFTSRHSGNDSAEYARAAENMIALATDQPGFLGIESVRDADGTGITVSYWRDEDSIRRWYTNAEHQLVQQLGREKWYQRYIVRVAQVEREYGFP